MPIKPNLAAWLNECEEVGAGVPDSENVVNQLMKLVVEVNKGLPKDTPEATSMAWKKNAAAPLVYQLPGCRVCRRCSRCRRIRQLPAIIEANYLQPGEARPGQGMVQRHAGQGQGKLQDCATQDGKGSPKVRARISPRGSMRDASPLSA